MRRAFLMRRGTAPASAAIPRNLAGRQVDVLIGIS
jgi:hypothetical protein